MPKKEVFCWEHRHGQSKRLDGQVEENERVAERILSRDRMAVFHISLSLLIYDIMCAHLTEIVKDQVKKTNSELSIIQRSLIGAQG